MLMINFLRSKKLTAAILGLVIIMLCGLVVLCACFISPYNKTSDPPIFLEGEYSVDGGEWNEFDSGKEISQTFNKIIFYGRPLSSITSESTVTIIGKNVRYTLYDDRGTVITQHRYYRDEEARKLLKESPLSDYYKESGLETLLVKPDSLQSNYPDTPGYIVHEIPGVLLNSDKNYFLAVEYPYESPKQYFSDCFEIIIGSTHAAYVSFFHNAFPMVTLFALICFFGVVFFPIAGFILGKINYKFFSFGSLCFFWGLFMIFETVGSYLNLWVYDSVVCMITDVLTNYFFAIAMLFYLKANLEKSFNRAIANSFGIAYFIFVITAIVLQFTNVIDLYASSRYMFAYTILSVVVMALLLFRETRSNKKAFYMLISWIPLAISILLDVFNYYLIFTRINFYTIGIFITLIYQIVCVVLDLRTQYKESIRYQQMQKELYEAKVSVMVSQIQPHFLYNSLTSIAMMCTKDPKLAKSATINFADYLRGNMNSLKQTSPVPFTQELEHLKKYLMLEQMRFGDLLNIEYDIRAVNFSLPQLSVQPLVENAVKHGVGMKEDGGTVTIATRELPDHFEVIISDDGVGFDSSAPPKNDGRSHVGMENTKQRIKDMCGGEVVIESEPGKGCVATIKIPKEDDSK